MQFEPEGQIRAYASIAERVNNPNDRAPHPNARRSDQAWDNLNPVAEDVLQEELETASILFFTAGSTGRRYLSELSDILRCAKKDSYMNDKLPILFSKGVHLEQSLRRYLCFKVRASIARKSHLPKEQQIPLQYMTLRDIALDLVTITKYVVDLEEQEAQKLARKLFAQCRTLQAMFHLPAHRKTRVTFYEEECRLCIEWALRNFNSRDLAIQFGLAVTTFFYTAARPSSVVKTSNTDEFLALRDIEISRHTINGVMVGFDVVINFKHFKGRFYGHGKQVLYAVNTVENRGNLLLDLGCWLVATLYRRGVWPTLSPEELWSAKEKSLPIPAKHLDEPVFLAGTNGGRGLGFSAADAHLLNEQIKLAAAGADLNHPGAIISIYCIRRGTATTLIQLVGIEKARSEHSFNLANALFKNEVSADAPLDQTRLHTTVVPGTSKAIKASKQEKLRNLVRTDPLLLVLARDIHLLELCAENHEWVEAKQFKQFNFKPDQRLDVYMALCDQYGARLAVLKASLQMDEEAYLKNAKSSLPVEQVIQNRSRFDKTSDVHDEIIDKAMKELLAAEWVTESICQSLTNRGGDISALEKDALTTGGRSMIINIPCGEPALRNLAIEQADTFDAGQQVDLTNLEEFQEHLEVELPQGIDRAWFEPNEEETQTMPSHQNKAKQKEPIRDLLQTTETAVVGEDIAKKPTLSSHSELALDKKLWFQSLCVMPNMGGYSCEVCQEDDTVSIANKEHVYVKQDHLERHQRTQFHSNRNQLMRYLSKYVDIDPETETTRPNFPTAFRRVTPEDDFALKPADYRCRWCEAFAEGRKESCTPAHLIRHIKLKHPNIVPERYNYGLHNADDPGNVLHARRQQQKLSSLDDISTADTFTRAALMMYQQIEHNVKSNTPSKESDVGMQRPYAIPKIGVMACAEGRDDEPLTLTETEMAQLSSGFSFHEDELALVTDPMDPMRIEPMELDSESDAEYGR
ncbi:hypothetical protein QFC19_001248 [Naganishia cerealis]|uniref:Uncharacterized protein n=1 Tax=Naganishia cerealis TaxID=610337 RepID=A0ACC2WI74_9TREE|nr:hypothetical protein QFC19_001248 [Naganishia cerealis]